MHTGIFAISVAALATFLLTAGCSAAGAPDTEEEVSGLASADEEVAGAWVSTNGEISVLVLNPGDSRLETTRQAFTAIVKVSCSTPHCKPRETVRGTWTLEGDRLRLTNFPGDSTPESTGDVGYASAMRTVFGDHRLTKQGDKLTLSNAKGSTSFAYHGSSYCDDYVASQCRDQFPVCEGRNGPRSPRISEWKSLPRSGKCVDEEKRCELTCDTSYRGQELDGKEYVIAAGTNLEVYGPSRLNRPFLPEQYEWKSESPSISVKTRSTSESSYPAGTYDLHYRFVVDKNAPRGSVHRIKHATSPWTFTIRVR